ncbi:hypothetical protein [Azospirillum doebereinerae]
MSTPDFTAMFGLDKVQAVSKRLKTDAAFRAEAEADFNAALKAHYGVDLPQPLRLVEDNGVLTTIPAESSELSDDELDLVAGGVPMMPSTSKTNGGRVTIG